MLNIVSSNRFKKDLAAASKRGMQLKMLYAIIDQLAAGQQLASKHRDHALSGNYAGFRECHIQPDWLLVYRIEENDLMLFLFRTGTHSDIF